jgi:dolichol kinase
MCYVVELLHLNSVLQTLRILAIPPLGAAIDRCFQVFIDDRDGGKIITTHLYLLIGCSCPLWLYGGYF